MAISSNNIQVYSTLSKDLVAEIDKDAKKNFRTRSQQINMILTEYYMTNPTSKSDSKKALELRMPVAVNISFGNTYGAHEPYN